MKTLRTLMLLVLTFTVAAVHAENNKAKAEKAAVSVTINPDRPTMAPEVQPRFLGGEQALFEFVSQNLRTPKGVDMNKIEGKKATIRVVITAEGQVRSARIVKGVGCAQCDQEALRIVYAMPNWIPAQVGGRNVASYYTIPVTFGK